MEKYKILVVDDEDDICEILQYNLSRAGYTVDTAGCAEEALYKLKSGYDLLLLDIMMNGLSGLKLARLLREDYHNNIPIIFISALDAETDILNGFSQGGDDYISKPFSVKEVLARIKAVLNRYACAGETAAAQEIASGTTSSGSSGKNGISGHAGPAPLIFGDLKIDTAEKRIYIGEKEVVLTKKEDEILLLLAGYPDKFFTRDDILEKVWKDESYVLVRTVDVHIARLRKKLGPYGDMIINRSGYGYCFRPAPAAATGPK